MTYLLTDNRTLVLVDSPDRETFGDGLSYRCRHCKADIPSLPRAPMSWKYNAYRPDASVPCPGCGTLVDIEHLTPHLK